MNNHPRPLLVSLFVFGILLLPQAGRSAMENPIIYVTQVPISETTNTVVSLGGNHLASPKAAPRGGDLHILYPDATQKNLTRVAGYGTASTLQRANAIAVRDPSVHSSGTRAIFSMVANAPTGVDDDRTFYWQLYEVTGLGKQETPVITRVAGQPEDFNNIQPTYGSDDSIIFVSDRTLDGGRTTYPALNEQGDPTVTGLWKLDPARETVTLFDHSPSGSFSPFVDSFGRLVFSRWDHLQRDEHAATSGAVDYTSEDEGAATTAWSDIFPEALTNSGTSLAHKFDVFLPWTVNQDGTELLTMNHLGRHEIGMPFDRARTDNNLANFDFAFNPFIPVLMPTRAGSYLQISEHRSTPGKYLATDAASTAVSAGRLVTFEAPPSKNPDEVRVVLANGAGLARDASYLDDGRLIGSFATGPIVSNYYGDDNFGTVTPLFIPPPGNPFQIKVANGSVNLSVGTAPIPTTSRSVTNFVDGALAHFDGPLWQLQPVEVLQTSVAESTPSKIDSPETKMFVDARVSVTKLKQWLKENEMALVISRNVTSRDGSDQQQPINLLVPGGTASIADAGPTYQVTNLQFFQGDYVRGYANPAMKGRRIKAQVLHDDKGENAVSSVAGSTSIAPDGSAAMLVPARRALTWQLTDGHGEPVVRERYWLSFQAGEIRTCTNCHGNNSHDQLGRSGSSITNPPLALKSLLTDWKGRHPDANADASPFQIWSELNIAPNATADGDSDRDELSNIEEYLYGSDPNVRSVGETAVLPFQSKRLSDGQVALTFTRDLEAVGLHVSIESSTDMIHWDESATLDGSTIQTDGSISVTTTATAEQNAENLEQINALVTEPTQGNHTRYYRLRIDAP